MTNSSFLGHSSENWLAAIATEKARRHLNAYIEQAWPVVRPKDEYVRGWHIDAICAHLEAATRGEIRNLIINIPPRHMKSLSVCVFWPTWVWIEHPEKCFLTTSYAESLAIRDAVRSRRLMQSEWWQERWGDSFYFAGDQNQKSRYENDKGGHRIATGIGGSSTGEGGDFLIVDDPLKVEDADSDAKVDAANDFWDHTLSTRGNDPKTVVKVVIMQRLRQDDLTGHILEQAKESGEEWVHLCLPAEYEEAVFSTGIDVEGQYSEPGELLWEERFPQEELDALKAILGERMAAGQLQQRPAPPGGIIFKRDWWSEGKARFDVQDHPFELKMVGRYLSFDTALKDKETNDYTAMGVWDMTPDYRIALREVWWKRLQFPQLSKVIEDEIRRWNVDGKLRGVVIEDKGSGISSLQTLYQSLPEDLAELLNAFQPQGSKVARARQASLWCERGCVLLPSPGPGVPWLLDFEKILFDFPGVPFDDPVDQLTQIVIWLEHYLAEGWHARSGPAKK